MVPAAASGGEFVSGELDGLLGPALVDAIERLVDARVEAALREHDANGSSGSPWLTVLEAADYLRVSGRTLERLLERGRVRTSTIGRRRLLHRDELDAYTRATTGEDEAPATPSRRRRERTLDGTRRRL